MTYEEALSRANFCIEEWKMFLKDKANTVEAVRYQNDSSQMQFFEVAAEAINKQIPKKPIEEWSNSPFSEDRGCKFLHLMCPNCKKMEVCELEYFCLRCGQALDWSDAE